MRTNAVAVDLIKLSESLSLKAYRCPAGVWTIGWGTTRYPNKTKVQEGDRCGVELAQGWFDHELSVLEKRISKLIDVDVTENQFSALVSLAYNIGIGNFKKSTLLKNLNSGDTTEASEQFLVWRKAGGKILKGLEIRRAKEKELFDS